MIFKLLLLVLCTLVQSDIYLHNPSGSNNRLDEQGRERNNANRMFNSQNNNRGGYNVGNLYYLEGSQLQVEWTNQHSCGGPNANCDIILQYMCSDNLRDGYTTNAIPSNLNGCAKNDCNTDVRFGMNEDYEYYMRCTRTLRNRGLFTADQSLRGVTAQYTRQNNAGTRYAYECPEERDYYPYWRSTPWKDIVVMTSDTSRCDFYKSESENVKSRFYCDPPSSYMNTPQVRTYLPITKEACEKFDWPQGSRNFSKWIEIKSKNMRQPDCIPSPKSRDNHNGNGLGGFANTYNWTVPNDISENCVLRLRYNISTGDLSNYVTSSVQVARICDGGTLLIDTKGFGTITILGANYGRTSSTQCGSNARFNNNCNNQQKSLQVVKSLCESQTSCSVKVSSSVFGGDPCVGTVKYLEVNYTTSTVSIGTLVGLSDTEATNRGYVFKNNPVVQPLKTGNPTLDGKLQLRIAINTAQYGRTFQDRSHRFAIRPRPAEYKNSNIYNLNVRGKRGNIVQVFPAVEYDFVPSRLTLSASDAIHIQWTGSNTNPNNNAGQGTAGTDRSNIILLKDKNYPEGNLGQAGLPVNLNGQYGNNYPMLLSTSKSFLGFGLNDVKQLAFSIPNGVSSDPLLNDAAKYFDLGPRPLKNAVGTYYYMCTRNNNFSNRSQKGKIVVLPQTNNPTLPQTNPGVSPQISGGNILPQINGDSPKYNDRRDPKKKQYHQPKFVLTHKREK
ncbi:protein DD3-3 isoform X1 [Hydra vulgaris]|uniref:protein DD3-3 isoform X1 n=1 Tax=Hydra vulgaris TaxID=6087 RepID=UPI001F5F7485|nr:protein DD3-3-like [Hydra vulgaris]